MFKDGFVLRPWRREFQLFGERLGSMTRTVFVWERSFSDLPEEPDQLVLPLLAANPGVGGAVIGSQPVQGDLPVFEKRGSIIRYAPTHFTRRILRRTVTFDEFLHSMTTGTRQKLSQKARKLIAVGGRDVFRVYESPADLDQFLLLAQELAPRTYQARLLGRQLGTTPAASEQVMAWAHEGRAIAASVVLDGRAAAFWFFLLHGRGVLESVYTGYDTAYEKLSPGTLLVYFFLEQVFFGDSRFSILDWTEGDAEYKRIFSNDSVRCAQLMYLRPTPGPLSLLAVDAAILGVRSVTRPLVASLKRSGYAATIRRWRRGH